MNFAKMLANQCNLLALEKTRKKKVKKKKKKTKKNLTITTTLSKEETIGGAFYSKPCAGKCLTYKHVVFVPKIESQKEKKNRPEI